MIYDLHIEVLAILFVILCAISSIICLTCKKRNYILFTCFLILYVLLTIKITIFPFTSEKLPAYRAFDYSLIQLVPFKTIVDEAQRHLWFALIGNAVLLVPIPVLLLIKPSRPFSLKTSIIVCILSSITIEVCQFLINLVTHISNHVVDVDDLILNILGGIISSSIIAIIVFFKKNHKT